MIVRKYCIVHNKRLAMIDNKFCSNKWKNEYEKKIRVDIDQWK